MKYTFFCVSNRCKVTLMTPVLIAWRSSCSWHLSSLCSHLLSSEYVERHFKQNGRPSQSVVRPFAWGGGVRILGSISMRWPERPYNLQIFGSRSRDFYAAAVASKSQNTFKVLFVRWNLSPELLYSSVPMSHLYFNAMQGHFIQDILEADLFMWLFFYEVQTLWLHPHV